MRFHFQNKFACIALAAAMIVATACGGCASTGGATPTPPAAPTSAAAGGTTLVAIAPPSVPHPSLPELLGIPEIFSGVGQVVDHSMQTLGRLFPIIETSFPGLEPTPPVLPLTDPANAESPNPAVKAAAEAKEEENEAPQKIKAIKYLSSLGCGGCKPKVEGALLAALDDCTEAIRFEAVTGIRDSAGTPCSYCRTHACCSPKIRKKLESMANEVDDYECYLEPSGRVRRIARLALDRCGPQPEMKAVPQEGPESIPPPLKKGPDEGPSPNVPPPPDPAVPETAPEITLPQASLSEENRIDSESQLGGSPSDRRRDVIVKKKLLAIIQNDTDIQDDMGAAENRNTDDYVDFHSDLDNENLRSTPEDEVSSRPRRTVSIAKRTGKSIVINPDLSLSNPVSLRNVEARNVEIRQRIQSSKAADGKRKVVARFGVETVDAATLKSLIGHQLQTIEKITSPERQAQALRTLARRELNKYIQRKLLAREAHQSRDAAEIVLAGFQPQKSDSVVAADWLERNTQIDQPVAAEEIATYYQKHLKQFQVVGLVRWERVTARYDDFETRKQARTVITYLRNRAIGVNSQVPEGVGFEAVESKTYGWSSPATIRSKFFSRVLADLPVGSISLPVADALGVHILRLLERQPAQTKPLEDVAAAIRKTILKKRRTFAEDAYLRKLFARAKVWTIFDGPATRGKATSEQPSPQ